MYIRQLQVENFRNLASQSIPFSPTINLITGANGAGKTALLEAIYFLGRQRSFRTAQNKDLLQQNKNYFRLIASTEDPNHLIGLERRLEKQQLQLTLRIDRTTQKTPASLAKLCPILALSNKSFQLVDSSPIYRRQFMDYGSFQLHPAFYEASLRYQKSLKNRNAALKQQLDNIIIASFTQPLLENGLFLHQCRYAFFQQFEPLFSKHLNALEFPIPINLHYYAGWPSEESLENYLKKQLSTDRRLQHTHTGPHRADWRFSVLDGNADNRLSRGQQKTLILALHLAQIDLLQMTGKKPILIFDDITAELDSKRRDHTLDYLLNLNCQMFFSATEAKLFDYYTKQQAALFHLQQGKIK